jgi:hypothetical protein
MKEDFMVKAQVKTPNESSMKIPYEDFMVKAQAKASQ